MLGLVKIIKGNCLDKLCFYNYPVVKTKSDNNNNNNNIYNIIRKIIKKFKDIYKCKTILIMYDVLNSKSTSPYKSILFLKKNNYTVRNKWYNID